MIKFLTLLKKHPVSLIVLSLIFTLFVMFCPVAKADSVREFTEMLNGFDVSYIINNSTHKMTLVDNTNPSFVCSMSKEFHVKIPSITLGLTGKVVNCR